MVVVQLQLTVEVVQLQLTVEVVQPLSADSTCITNHRPPVQLTVEEVQLPKGLMELEWERQMWRLRLGRVM